MKKEISLLGLLMMGMGTAFGQYAGDAFRYNEIQQTGTARFRGVGGNHAALGGDASTTFGNPAGIGFFNRSEISVSPTLSLFQTESTFIGQRTSATKTNPNIGHFGLVIAGNAQNEARRWRRASFGITYARLVNLNNSLSFEGRNNRSSFVDQYILDANDRRITGAQLDRLYNPDLREAQDPTAAAYQLYLINGSDLPNDPNNSGAPYTRYDSDRPTTQRLRYNSSGGQNQWSFTYGGNYDDKLYLGVTLGITRLRFDYDVDYSENIIGGSVFRRVGREEGLTVTGNGINLAVGTIWKATDFIQLGASVTTPTFSTVRETFSESLNTDAIGIPTLDQNGRPTFFIPDNQNITVTPNNFEYNLTSPLRAMAGATYFLGAKKVGFITATAEYVGYSGMRVSSSQADAGFRDDIRSEIQSTYQNVVNFRAGAEVRTGLLRLRGGVSYLPDPYKQAFQDLDRTKLLISGGLGVRNDRFFADASATYNTFKSGYTPYSLPNPSDYASAEIDNRLVNVTLTVGAFF
ncbi:hypothetical protein [Tellurirhabdus rosea]|uniref:hypothetical protein n=1 Tax=Tellurirhabdus rosea TaxID=2674997 RepID=UPI0022582521|nr:hypothetical protein [Tellurirhabdus rosea]